MTKKEVETIHYYYGVRYYDPKVSVWLSVDPLAHEYPSLSPYVFVANNPIMLVDPNGMEIVYHEDNSLLFNIGTKLRIAWQSLFGTKETRNMISDLKSSPNEHTISERTGDSGVDPKSYADWSDSNPKPPIDIFDEEAWEKHDKEMKEYKKNEPTNYKDGSGDGSSISINYDQKIKNDGDHKKTKSTTLFHELFHAWRIDKGVAGEGRQTEEVKAVQFVNRNLRNENNRRKKYGPWLVPKEN